MTKSKKKITAKSIEKDVFANLSNKYGLEPSLHWWKLPHKKNNQNVWILTHDAVQIIADHEKIAFSLPEANWDTLPKIALLIVGELPSGKSDWSFGEVSTDNNFNKYPWAIAEKRAKDRVTLKLIGLYKLGIYSETEADDFKRPKEEPKKTTSNKISTAKRKADEEKAKARALTEERESLERKEKAQKLAKELHKEQEAKELTNKLETSLIMFDQKNAKETWIEITSNKLTTSKIPEIVKIFPEKVEGVLKDLRIAYTKLGA